MFVHAIKYSLTYIVLCRTYQEGLFVGRPELLTLSSVMYRERECGALWW